MLKRLFFGRQEDKEPTFDSVKTIVGMLEVSAEFAQNITFNVERIKKALPAGYLDATTLADYLVNKASHNLLFNFIFYQLEWLTFYQNQITCMIRHAGGGRPLELGRN